MEWNPVLEERLRQSKQTAGWRWVAYAGALIGLAVTWGGATMYADERDACIEARGPFAECPKSPIWQYLAPGLGFLAISIAMALPAEKAAKESRQLVVQKRAAETNAAAAAPNCARCGSAMVATYCANCGAPQPA